MSRLQIRRRVHRTAVDDRAEEQVHAVRDPEVADDREPAGTTPGPLASAGDRIGMAIGAGEPGRAAPEPAPSPVGDADADSHLGGDCIIGFAGPCWGDRCRCELSCASQVPAICSGRTVRRCRPERAAGEASGVSTDPPLGPAGASTRLASVIGPAIRRPDNDVCYLGSGHRLAQPTDPVRRSNG